MTVQGLEPLPYHVALRDYLKRQENHLWNWFASAKAMEDYEEHLRFELLKSCYRLDKEEHPDLHCSADEAKAGLQLDIPVTLYQAQNSPHLNASLYYIHGEGHVVFSGPVLTLLNQEEVKSVIAHELAHYHLWERDEGEYLIADRLLMAMGKDPRSPNSHVQSARWFQLYTEIFADRGSLTVTGNVEPVISGLVKIVTSLPQVSGKSYLNQAEEIFSKAKPKTAQLTHPEAFIRARALSLWAQGKENTAEEISLMIEGASDFDQLDLIGQEKLTSQTKLFLQNFLQPKWFQSDAVIGHAKLYFDDFTPAVSRLSPFPVAFNLTDKKVKDYFGYVMLDFVVADPDLDDVPLAAAFEMSSTLGIEEEFEKLVTKELKLKPRELKKIKEKAREMLEKAEPKS